LREARRQKGVVTDPVPDVCLLDPDGDIVRHLKTEGRTRPHGSWACYHTDLFVFEEGGATMGVVGCAVGAPFAVLVAEELFASGCKLLISITSSGQLVPALPPPYLILIERALRDEGTSYHYLPPAPFSDAPETVLTSLAEAFDDLPVPVLRGASWTTDAPFRETAEAIEAMRRRGLLAVEMEAAALCAFAKARKRDVVCFAHVTNQMGKSKVTSRRARPTVPPTRCELRKEQPRTLGIFEPRSIDSSVNHRTRYAASGRGATRHFLAEHR
jgi:uridine phosphorylase